MFRHIAAALAFSALAGAACAQTTPPAITGLTHLPQASSTRSSVGSAGGTGMVTGSVGNTQTTTQPGGIQGQLSNNGNGTSTLVEQGHGVQVVPTPR